MAAATHSFAPSQAELQWTVCCTVDGPSSARALQLVAAELRTGVAATLRLQILVKIVQATRSRRVTRKLVQVRFVRFKRSSDVYFCAYDLT